MPCRSRESGRGGELLLHPGRFSPDQATVSSTRAAVDDEVEDEPLEP